MSSAMPPDHAAREQAADPSHSVLLTAPAGSGKTGVLLLRYLRCLLCVESPEQVVAITYTKKAAAEIRERIMNALAAAQQPLADDSNAFEQAMHEYAAQVVARDAALGWNLLQDSARLRVSTIDSFTASIVRRLPLLSGMGSARTGDDQPLLYREAALSLLREWQKGGGGEALQSAISNVLAYTDNQYERLLPQLEYLIGRRDQWLFDLFSQSDEMRGRALAEHLQDIFAALLARLHKLGFAAVYAALQTIDSADEHWGFCAAMPDFSQLSPDDIPLLRRIARGLAKGSNLDELYQRRSLKQYAKLPPDSTAIAAVGDWVEAMEAQGDAGACFAALAKLPATTLSDTTAGLNADLSIVLLHLLTHLQLQFDQLGEADYCEIALRAIQALSGEGADVDVDALLREQRIEHLLVDEMQDTSANQFRLLESLCANWLPDDGRSIFLCGDLMQSIYGFRGAVPRLFSALASRSEFANRPLRSLQLTANFRSVAAVVEWCNRSFEVLTRDAGGRQPFVAADAQLSGDGAVIVKGFVTASVPETIAVETKATLEIIEERLSSDAEKPSIAVLVRSRGHLAALTDALDSKGIAYSAQKTVSLQQTAPIRGLLHLLWALWHGADDVAWVGVVREPWVGLGWEDIRRLRSGGGDLRSALADAGLLQSLSAEGQQRCARLNTALAAAESRAFAANLSLLVNAVWHGLGGPAQLSDSQRIDVERFFTLLDRHVAGGILQSRPAFERQLAELYAAPAAGEVQLLTMHGAKGLEYDVVIMPQLGRSPPPGKLPLFLTRELGSDAAMVVVTKSQQPDEEQELLYGYFSALAKDDARDDTLRLLYVACTRARRQLYLLGSVKETKAGIKPASGSLLAAMWPALEADFADPEVQLAADNDAPEEDILYPVIAPRIGLDARVSLCEPVLPPQQASSALERQALAFDLIGLEDNIESRATGLVYHEMADRISRLAAQSGLDDVAPALPLWQDAILARLRHHCHPRATLGQSAARVTALLDNTLNCEHGRWILTQPGPAWNEQPLLRRHGQLWRRLVIDRLFIEDGCCWIIDYKTSGSDGDGTGFITAEAARYAAKMHSYREAVIAAGVAPEVRIALYFPALQILHRYPDSPV